MSKNILEHRKKEPLLQIFFLKNVATQGVNFIAYERERDPWHLVRS